MSQPAPARARIERQAMTEIRCVTGATADPYVDDLARLRIEVFRAFPYLYDGDVDYERRYLATYAAAPQSLFVLALDQGRVVGVSTGIPLAQETAPIKSPWLAAGIDPATLFYFGESVLLPAYRGQGIGHRFFDEREAYASGIGGMARTVFCAVDRGEHHPARPAGYRSLHAFWRSRGYRRHDGLCCTMRWKDVGCEAETGHRLDFWSRPLSPVGRVGAAST